MCDGKPRPDGLFLTASVSLACTCCQGGPSTREKEGKDHQLERTEPADAAAHQPGKGGALPLGCPRAPPWGEQRLATPIRVSGWTRIHVGCPLLPPALPPPNRTRAAGEGPPTPLNHNRKQPPATRRVASGHAHISRETR